MVPSSGMTSALESSIALELHNKYGKAWHLCLHLSPEPYQKMTRNVSSVNIHQDRPGTNVLPHSPRLERVLDLSMMAFLLSTERLASDRSAVTRVMEILQKSRYITSLPQLLQFKG